MPKITDQGLLKIAHGCPRLETLDISEASHITNESLKAVISCCSLKELVLRFCQMVRDDTLQALVDHCPELSFIDLSFCQTISSAGLLVLATGAKNLKFVSLVSVGAYDAKMAPTFPEGCTVIPKIPARDGHE